MNIVVTEDTTGWAPRSCRFTAYDDDTWDGAEDSRNRHYIGFGATPDEAITDLRRLLEEVAAEEDAWRRGPTA